jgi:uncharacterized OsmC-like protein
MELLVNYLGNVQFEAETRGHKIICDQPFDSKGDDEGMTPPELLLASLATCAGYYAVEYLNTRNLPKEALRVKISAEKAKNPARLGKFVIAVEVPGLTDPHHIEGVRRSVEKCLIKNTLLVAPEIQVDIRSFEPAAQ